MFHLRPGEGGRHGRERRADRRLFRVTALRGSRGGPERERRTSKARPEDPALKSEHPVTRSTSRRPGPGAHQAESDFAAGPTPPGRRPRLGAASAAENILHPSRARTRPACRRCRLRDLPVLQLWTLSVATALTAQGPRLPCEHRREGVHGGPYPVAAGQICTACRAMAYAARRRVRPVASQIGTRRLERTRKDRA
jgi:hypothetical protein